MTPDFESLLEAKAEQLPALLAGVDLREWLRETLAHQLDYQRQISAAGSFDPDHPALRTAQYARLRALGYLDEDAMPEILELLGDPESSGSNPVVWSVCDALTRMGKRGGKAAPALLQRLLSDGITEFPSRIVGALAAVSTNRDAVRDALNLQLDSPEEGRVLAALYALPAFEASEALPRILALTRSPVGEIRAQATLALSALGQGQEQVQARLLELTRDAEWYVRGNAIDGLGAMGVASDQVRQSAIRILDEDDHTPDWSAPECAARTLRAMGGSVKALQERLLRPGISPGLAEECIRAMQEAGITDWADTVRQDFGYLLDECSDWDPA